VASSKLSVLQHMILDAFFAEPTAFFLTGGGALGGFHLCHRTTEDLDLFAPPGASMDLAVQQLQRTVAEIGGHSKPLQTTPEFRRFVVIRSSETTLVDLVIDRSPQVVPIKERVGAIALDPAREIAANKICALLGRSEPRDLVDLFALLSHGHELASVMMDARTKDTSVDPATLGWVLSQWRLGPLTRLPEGATPARLEQQRHELIERLLRMALPPN